MEELKLPKINNEINITQEQYDELIKKLRILTFQMQEHQDTLEGGLTANNVKIFLNTYVINEKDSLDASYPMYVHFNIIDEMVKIVSVKVSFWILNYRAYSTAATEKEAVTSGASSAESSASGGADTSGVTGGSVLTNNDEEYTLGTIVPQTVYPSHVTATGVPYKEDTSSSVISSAPIMHKHYMGNHTHSTPAHTHNIPHTHSVPAHSHDITYGIFEEETSPTIKFYISDTGEDNYSDTFFGGYTADKANINIKDYITGVGSKMIKFTSTTRTRLSVQIEVKLEVQH